MTTPNERRPREATEGDEKNTRAARSLPIIRDNDQAAKPECKRCVCPGAAESAAVVDVPELVAIDEDATQVRCLRCRSPLSRPSSVAIGYGRVCLSRLDADELEGVDR